MKNLKITIFLLFETIYPKKLATLPEMYFSEYFRDFLDFITR